MTAHGLGFLLSGAQTLSTGLLQAVPGVFQTLVGGERSGYLEIEANDLLAESSKDLRQVIHTYHCVPPSWWTEHELL